MIIRAPGELRKTSGELREARKGSEARFTRVLLKSSRFGPFSAPRRPHPCWDAAPVERNGLPRAPALRASSDSLNICQNQSKLMKINENQSKLMKINGNQ